MSEALLHGTRVVDLAGEPAAMGGRILADLGAEVVKVEPPDGDPLRSETLRFAAWNAGKTGVIVSGPEDPTLATLLGGADVVLDTPGWPGTIAVDPSAAPQAVWVSVTPFGLTGRRTAWRASDLGVMAASGNMYATGDPDRAPVRCSEPSGYAHTGPEAALAALTGLASGRPQRIDLSMQETILVANMGSPAQFPKTGFRGSRRGANIGRTREIWPCKDGYVSFGLRGGKARVPSLQTIAKLAGLGERDWDSYSPNRLSDEELRAIEEPIAAYFAVHTMTELYELATTTTLMLAPANTPREIDASPQLDARRMFGPLGEYRRFPLRFVEVRAADGEVAPARAAGAEPALGVDTPPAWTPRTLSPHPNAAPRGAWHGVRLIEFGSGAAGPIATRYFAEHGATVIRIESRSRPDFLRVYALGPDNPHALDGAPMFDALNAGKRSIALNLKHPAAVDLVRRLVDWADAVAENFAPKAMRGFGLDYDRLAQNKPDLVMISACLNGQTGPHKDYPGFGGQGSALSGFNALTGWPDREPVGPHGTITDSLAPRFVAAALAAGLLYRRRTGRGVYLDLSQVEAAIYSLSPWMLEYTAEGLVTERIGNRSRRAAPHGAFACSGKDRWVAIAVWTDDEWARLAAVLEDKGLAALGPLDTVALRLAHQDQIEAALAAWTATRAATDVAEQLQALGIEAVPVNDFGDLHSDPQLAERGHFVALTHPIMGPGLYEHNGFRLSDAPCGYDRTGPVLGADTDELLRDLLGLDDDAIGKLRAEGAVE
jgi:crotonobetainyl-CoA:carnitine CoA-transferase CaiB-like acyl-CoA transferase